MILRIAKKAADLVPYVTVSSEYTRISSSCLSRHRMH